MGGIRDERFRLYSNSSSMLLFIPVSGVYGSEKNQADLFVFGGTWDYDFMDRRIFSYADPAVAVREILV